MTARQPVTELDERYSMKDVSATPWPTAREQLERAELYWLTTVRPDNRPHVTPLLAVWVDDALHFCTGPDERKAKNLRTNTHCILTTGCNGLDDGLDVVVEGDAVQVTGDAALQKLATAYETKYGKDWHFDVRDGAFRHEAGRALVFRVAPTTAFGFAKGRYSQTRWRFPAGAASPATD